MQTSNKPPIGRAEVERAAGLLARYRRGKQAFDRRVIDDERWYRLRHGGPAGRGSLRPLRRGCSTACSTSTAT